MVKKINTMRAFGSINNLWDGGFLTHRELAIIHKRINKVASEQTKKRTERMKKLKKVM